jgi:hypothetical protein
MMKQCFIMFVFVVSCVFFIQLTNVDYNNSVMTKDPEGEMTMNAMDYLRIAPFLNDCPNCGYDSVGTNETTGEYHGALLVEENLFTRKCRCGFEVTIDSNIGTENKIINEQINDALELFKEKQ